MAKQSLQSKDCFHVFDTNSLLQRAFNNIPVGEKSRFFLPISL